MNSAPITTLSALAPYGRLTGGMARRALSAASEEPTDVLQIAQKIMADERDADVCVAETSSKERWILNVRSTGGLAPPERHRDWHDLSLYLLGGNDLRVEGELTDAEEVSEGEWRKGALVDGTVFPVRAGELLWTPAGVAHQSRFLPQTAFIIVKIHRDATATIGALDRITDRSHPQHIPSFASFC